MRTTPPTTGGRLGRQTRHGWAFLAPFLGLFLLFQVVPIGYAVVQSLQEQQWEGLGLGGPVVRFAGLANYERVFQDDDVIGGVARVLLYGAVQVPVMLLLALAMALLFDAGLTRGRRFFQFSAFLPHAVPGVVAAVLWAYLYVPGISPVVEVLEGTSLETDFLGPDAVLWSIANIATWQWTGYNMLIIFAALQAVPRELFEAARIDGASAWGIAWRVKIPLVRPALVLTALFSVIGTLQLFSEPLVVRSLSANVTATYTPNMAAYSAAFGVNDPNYAAAIAVSLAVVAFALSYGLMRAAQRGVDA
ncbi:carbohydrate ABC transporter permease [Streptomyces sp. SBT349]|uniref:carbohydrate ABC transporter permease n=1 Tax=Streptomyces sp. SBT349 TaxID=1580539 RepID=UPI00066AAEDD|nr:sugar ABC transporter permease [Streptomyces sp. SBT349]